MALAASQALPELSWLPFPPVADVAVDLAVQQSQVGDFSRSFRFTCDRPVDEGPRSANRRGIFNLD
jgi:hypothetical protein